MIRTESRSRADALFEHLVAEGEEPSIHLGGLEVRSVGEEMDPAANRSRLDQLRAREGEGDYRRPAIGADDARRLSGRAYRGGGE